MNRDGGACTICNDCMIEKLSLGNWRMEMKGEMKDVNRKTGGKGNKTGHESANHLTWEVAARFHVVANHIWQLQLDCLDKGIFS